MLLKFFEINFTQPPKVFGFSRDFLSEPGEGIEVRGILPLLSYIRVDLILHKNKELQKTNVNYSPLSVVRGMEHFKHSE